MRVYIVLLGAVLIPLSFLWRGDKGIQVVLHCVSNFPTEHSRIVSSSAGKQLSKRRNNLSG